MNPLLLIINASPRDTERLRECLEELAEEIDCLALEGLAAAASWLRANSRPVTAVFVGGETGPAIFSLVHLLRWCESTRSALIFRLVESADEDWARSLCELGEALDCLLLKPFDEEMLRKRLVPRPHGVGGGRTGTALILDDAAGAERAQKRLLRDSLSRCGYYRLYEVRDGGSALDLLREKTSEIALVVCDWEMPSLGGARFLRQLFQIQRGPHLGVLIVTSKASVEQMRAVQLAAPEISRYLLLPSQGTELRLQISNLLARIDKQRRADSFLREAKLFMARGKYEYADEILNHGVKTLPDVACLFEGLGNVLRARGERVAGPSCLQRAALAFETALRLEPMKSRWALVCMELYLALGKASEGIRVARHQLLRYGFDDTLRARLGQLFLECGDYRAARIELKRAFCLNPDNEELGRLLDRVDLLDLDKQGVV